MALCSWKRWHTSVVTSSLFTLCLLVALSSPAFASAAHANLVQISSDPFTNSTSQHKTQVEPDTYAFGSTIVATFQSGRFFDGGASDIGWATSKDAGKSWTHGFLPGITVNAGGPYDRVSDPTVAYDAAHHAWQISTLAFNVTPPFADAILISRSPDGLNWGNPVTVQAEASGTGFDKNWNVCDATPSSPFYGHCYVEWDDSGFILMSTSGDGGITWGSPKTVPGQNFFAIGGQPLVQPSGKVIVPISAFGGGPARVVAFTSTDGGGSWNSAVTVAPMFTFFENASIRDGGGLTSAEIDGSGKVYVVWQDCRFEPNCAINYGSANDIVMSTSTDGVTWSSVQRIPIDPVGSNINHIIPGIGVDKHTSGSTAHLALTFYYFTDAACFTFNCQFDVGFVSSTNSGASWSTKTQLAGPMNLTWLADTNEGYMVGDYISTSIVGDDAFPAFAVSSPPSGGHLNEAMFTVQDTDLKIVGGSLTSKGDAVTVSGVPRPVRAFSRTAN
jgi:hypothetical protein